MSLGRFHPGASVGFAVQLAPHKEVALLLEAHIAIGTDKTSWMAVVFTNLHYGPSERKISGGKGGKVDETLWRVRTSSLLHFQNEINHQFLILLSMHIRELQCEE